MSPTRAGRSPYVVPAPTSQTERANGLRRPAASNDGGLPRSGRYLHVNPIYVSSFSFSRRQEAVSTRHREEGGERRDVCERAKKDNARVVCIGGLPLQRELVDGWGRGGGVLGATAAPSF